MVDAKFYFLFKKLNETAYIVYANEASAQRNPNEKDHILANLYFVCVM